jgi:GAF domain-containing protein
MTSSIWRPSHVGAPGGKEISIHNFEELAALHAVAKILAQPGELREQIEQAMQEMSDRLGMQRGMISLLDRETGEAWLDVAHNVNIQGLDVTYQPGEGITGKVAQTGRPFLDSVGPLRPGADPAPQYWPRLVLPGEASSGADHGRLMMPDGCGFQRNPASLMIFS